MSEKWRPKVAPRPQSRKPKAQPERSDLFGRHVEPAQPLRKNVKTIGDDDDPSKLKASLIPKHRLTMADLFQAYQKVPPKRAEQLELPPAPVTTRLREMLQDVSKNSVDDEYKSQILDAIKQIELAWPDSRSTSSIVNLMDGIKRALKVKPEPVLAAPILQAPVIEPESEDEEDDSEEDDEPEPESESEDLPAHVEVFDRPTKAGVIRAAMRNLSPSEVDWFNSHTQNLNSENYAVRKIGEYLRDGLSVEMRYFNNRYEFVVS